MDHLDSLENQSIFIIREAYSEFRQVAMLWSIGKDSTALLWLMRKAFFGKIPFPVLHLDTGYKFKEIYKFRDKYAKKWDLDLIVAKNEAAVAAGVSPERGKLECCTELKTANLKKAISERTRAVLVPHILGNPAPIDQIVQLAQQHDLYVIEDVCESLGSTLDGRMLGTFGHMSTYSFYASHHITTGEGGAVATNDAHLARIIRSIRDWGRDCWCDHRAQGSDGACGKRFGYQIPGVPGTYDHKYVYSHVGYNLHPTDLQAAIGLIQIEKMPVFAAARKANFQTLYQGLSRYQDALLLPTWDPRADVCWF